MKRPAGSTEGIREALRPITSHDPTAEPQRPGYCVADNRNLFACEPQDGTHGGHSVIGLGVRDE